MPRACPAHVSACLGVSTGPNMSLRVLAYVCIPRHATAHLGTHRHVPVSPGRSLPLDLSRQTLACLGAPTCPGMPRYVPSCFSHMHRPDLAGLAMYRHASTCPDMYRHVSAYLGTPRHVSTCVGANRHVPTCLVMYLARPGMPRHVSSCAGMPRLAPTCPDMSRHVSACLGMY